MKLLQKFYGEAYTRLFHIAAMSSEILKGVLKTGVVILPRLGQAMAILGNSNIGNVAGNVFSIGNISNFVF